MNEIVTNQQNIQFMVQVGIYLISTLLAIMGVIFSLYMGWQIRVFKRLEDIDIETMKTANELKNRLNEHIGDSSYRFEVLQERLGKLENTKGSYSPTGEPYHRRKLDRRAPIINKGKLP